MQVSIEKGVVWSDGALRRHERYPCWRAARAVKQGTSCTSQVAYPFFEQHDRRWSVEIVERFDSIIRAIRIHSRSALASLS